MADYYYCHEASVRNGHGEGPTLDKVVWKGLAKVWYVNQDLKNDIKFLFVKSQGKKFPNREKQIQRPWGIKLLGMFPELTDGQGNQIRVSEKERWAQRGRREPDHAEIGRPWWEQCDLVRQSLGQCEIYLKKKTDWAITLSCLIKIIASKYSVLSCLSMYYIKSQKILPKIGSMINI